jgi:hypothetical protein
MSDLSRESVRRALEELDTPEVKSAIKAYYKLQQEKAVEKMERENNRLILEFLGAVVLLYAVLMVIGA